MKTLRKIISYPFYFIGMLFVGIGWIIYDHDVDERIYGAERPYPPMEV